MSGLTYGYDASRWSLCVTCGVLIPLFGMELVGPHVCGAGKAAREPLASLIKEERRVIQSQATEIAALRAQLVEARAALAKAEHIRRACEHWKGCPCEVCNPVTRPQPVEGE